MATMISQLLSVASPPHKSLLLIAQTYSRVDATFHFQDSKLVSFDGVGCLFSFFVEIGRQMEVLKRLEEQN